LFPDIGWADVATGTDTLNTNVSLAAFPELSEVPMRMIADDRAAHWTEAFVTVYRAVSSRLSALAAVDGVLLDWTADRLLFRMDSPEFSGLVIRDQLSGLSTPIPGS